MSAVDVLAVGAHPDDAELGVGGTLHALASQGVRVGILDLTRGEKASRGTPEERGEEAAEAARILGVAERRNAGLPDGAVRNDDASRAAVVAIIRELKPAQIVIHRAPDRHPDHAAAESLVRDANFLAGVARVEGGEPHRARDLYYYRPYFEDGTTPQFVVDITKSFDAKVKALRAYASQLHNPGYAGAATYVASEQFWDGIRIRAEYWGHRIGVRYGEAFFTDGPIGLTTLPGRATSQGSADT